MRFLPNLAGHLDNLAAETPCGRLPGEERQKACRHAGMVGQLFGAFWAFLDLFGPLFFFHSSHFGH